MRLIKGLSAKQFSVFVEQIKLHLLGESGNYSVEFIASICKFNKEMQGIRDRWIEELSTPVGLALLASDTLRTPEFWKRFAEFATGPSAQRDLTDYRVLIFLNDKDVKRSLGWDEHLDVVKALIDRGDPRLIRALFDWEKLNGVEVDWTQLERFLTLPLAEISAQDVASDFAIDKCFKLLSYNISADCKKRVLQEVNDPQSGYREKIICFFLPVYLDAKLADFSEETIKTIVGRLHFEKPKSYHPLLRVLKTVDEVTNVLGPYFDVKEEPFSSNLRQVLNAFGKVFSCRFGV